MCCTTLVGHFLRIRWKPKAINLCRSKKLSAGKRWLDTQIELSSFLCIMNIFREWTIGVVLLSVKVVSSLSWLVKVTPTSCYLPILLIFCPFHNCLALPRTKMKKKRLKTLTMWTGLHACYRASARVLWRNLRHKGKTSLGLRWSMAPFLSYIARWIRKELPILIPQQEKKWHLRDFSTSSLCHLLFMVLEWKMWLVKQLINS